MQLLNAICNRPWLITEDGLRTILHIAAREDLDPDLARQIREDRETRPAAVALRRAQRLDGARLAAIRDGVAIIPITGPIVRYRDFFTEISGLTSVEALATDVGIALEAPSVRGLLLTIDSPGGQVAGINELAEVLYRARGSKPVWTYVDGLAASAGYWLASATERIVTDETALLGSIGAVLAVRDPTKTTARDIEFVSSQSPNKRPDPTTDTGRAEFQRIVDQTAEVFIAAVARHRGMELEAVVEAGGRGGVLLGRRAVDAGLADQLGDFESTLAALAQDLTRRGGMEPLYRVAEPLFKLPTAARAATTTKEEDRMPPETPTTAPDLEARLVALEQQLAAERNEKAKAQAEAAESKRQIALAQEQAAKALAVSFADAQIRAARALPAQRADLEAVYLKLASVEGGVDVLTSLYANAPQHKLLAEHVAGDGTLTVLPIARGGSEEAQIAQDRERAQRYAERANARQNGSRH